MYTLGIGHKYFPPLVTLHEYAHWLSHIIDRPQPMSMQVSFKDLMSLILILNLNPLTSWKVTTYLIAALINIAKHLDAISIVAKKILLYLWPFGLCAWLMGTIFIDREKPKQAYETLEQASRILIENKVGNIE